MTTNETIGLAAYNRQVDLVDVRMSPDKFPRICNTPFAEAVNKMHPIVYAAFLYRGQEATPDTIRFIANALVAEIMADTQFGLPSLSWYEIGRSIRSAVLGAAKEMYGISVASLYSALIEYAKGEGHEAAKRAANNR